MLYSPHLLPTNYADNLAKVVECNERLMGEADVPYYVPVFRAWDSVLTDYPPDKWACPQQDAGGGVEMFYSDCQHQNPTGMALDAFTWYTVLTGGASAVGLQPRLPSGGVRQEPDTSLFNYLAGVGCEIGRRILVGMGYADDLQAPSPPTDLITSGKADSTIMLTWSPAADNVGVTHYEVLVDGVPYDTTTSTSMAISGVDMAEDRNLTVRAFDAAGHTSISSFPASTGSTVKYEAENNWWSYPDPDAVLQGFVSGYSGTGCIRVRTPGAMVSFRVYSPAAAVRPVDLRYNIYVWPEESMSRDISYYVNGDSIGEATLTTENRQRYYSFVENLPLEAGWNTVTYRFEGPEGEEINIDRISVEYDGAVGTHPGVTNGAHAAALQAVCVRPYSTARCAEMLLRSGGEQVARISVTDIAGHTLQRLSTRLARGNTIVRLSGAWLWNRLCLVTVETEAGRVTRRLLATR
jgi:hypothetical protein